MKIWADICRLLGLKLGKPVQRLRVLEDRGPGRGGRIAIPLAVASSIDVSRTAGGGDGILEIDRAMFQEIVDNFGDLPGPVAVHFGHVDDLKLTPEQKAKKKAAAFVERVWIEGDFLWGELSLAPQAFQAIVRDEGFRSFSIEADLDVPAPEGTIDGWSIIGGSITNGPALDVQFAAESIRPTSGIDGVRLSAVFPVEPEVPAMDPKKRLQKLEAALTACTDDAQKAVLQASIVDVKALIAAKVEATAANERTATAAAEAATATAEVARLQRATPPADPKVGTLAAELKVERERTDRLQAGMTARDVREICLAAVKDGVEPKFFATQGEGEALIPGYEDDPIVFLSKRFGGSLDALRASAATCPRHVDRAGIGSGAGAAGDPNPNDPHSKFEAAVSKIMAEKELDRSAAYDAVRLAQPELWRSIAAGYADPATRDGARVRATA